MYTASDMCAREDWSDCADAQSDQSLRYALWIAMGPRIINANTDDSDQIG